MVGLYKMFVYPVLQNYTAVQLKILRRYSVIHLNKKEKQTK